MCFRINYNTHVITLITITTANKIAITEETTRVLFLLLKLNNSYTSFLKGTIMIPVFLFVIAVLIFAWVIQHNVKKNTGNDKEKIASYLKRDTDANFARRKDISNLSYIQIPFDKLPLDITLKDPNMQSKIAEYQKNIRDMKEKKMLNLSGISNIELKENYGTANLELLTIYEGNYSNYIRTLSLYANAIFSEYPVEAVQLCEYCLEIGTDISSTYTLLGGYYLSHGNQDAFQHLYECVPDSETIAGKIIINKLDKMKNQASNKV